MRAECSRSVLVTKIGKLEAEVQHLRERSRVHQGEAAVRCARILERVARAGQHAAYESLKRYLRR